MLNTHTDGDLQVFSEFILYLREQGFSIGIHQYLRLHELLNKLGKDCAPSSLKTLLCPIFATSRLQQEQFYVAFDSFFGSIQVLLDSRSADPNIIGSTSIANQQLYTSQGRPAGLYIRMLFAVVFFILMLATSYNKRSLPANSQVMESGNNPVVILSNPPPDIGPPRISNSNTSSLSPISIFADREYELPISEPVRSASFWQKHGKHIHIIASLLPVIFLLAYEAYRFNQRRLILQRQRKKKPPYHYRIKVPTVSPRIYDSEQFYDTARLLRRRQVDEFFRLDINATITATVEARGYPSPKYKPGSKPSEYLVLINRASFRDHEAKLFDELVSAFINEQVLIERYFYEGDPRICFSDEGPTGIYLSDLQVQYTGHRLIVFGDGSRLINSLTGDLEPWVSLFQEWPQRVLLTPKPVQQWGLAEISLANQFIILPATLNSIKALMEYFDLPLIASPLRLQRKKDHITFNSHDHTALVQALRKQLGKETFQWLCACAVYPELQWDLTLYLSSLPCMPDGLVKEENLLRLIHLPWFLQGSMPDELRYSLISELEDKKEKAVRSALIELLNANPPSESLADTYAADSYQLNLAIQRWLYHPSYKSFRETLKFIKQIPANQIYKDQTIIRFLESKAPSPLHLILPKRIRTLFYREGIPAFGIRTFVRVLITCALIAIAWFGIKPLLPVADTIVNNKPQAVAMCRQTLFSTGSNIIDEAAKECLNRVVARLRENPDAMLVIDSHALFTDLLVNEKSLAQSRAEEVARYVSSRIPSVNIVIRNFGDECYFPETLPLAQRIVELWVLLGGATLSDLDNLKRCEQNVVEPHNVPLRQERSVPPLLNSLTIMQAHTYAIYSAAFSPNSDLIVTASGDETARVWEARTGLTRTILQGDTTSIYSAMFSPDGQLILTVSGDGTARVWSAETGQNVTTLPGRTYNINSAAFNSNSQLIVTGGVDGIARVWDVRTGLSLLTLQGHRGWIYDASFSPNSRLIVTASRDKTARVWDARTGQSRATLQGHTDTVYRATFSPDGRSIVTASWDGTARVWDAETGQIRVTLSGHTDWVYGASFSSDNRLIVTASFDGTARVWDALTGQHLATLQGHGDKVYGASFSPNGQMIVTASFDGTAQVWSARTGQRLATLQGHGDKVYSASFSPNGQMIVTASLDGTARVWALSP